MAFYSTLYWKVRRCLLVLRGVRCASVHGHAIGTLQICPDNPHVCVSGVHAEYRVRLYNYSVGVAKVSVERGFLVSRVYNRGSLA